MYSQYTYYDNAYDTCGHFTYLSHNGACDVIVCLRLISDKVQEQYRYWPSNKNKAPYLPRYKWNGKYKHKCV